MLLQAGQRIDRYSLIEPLGEGGQGAVWKAHDPLAPGAPCALKLVPVVPGRPNDLERARREARALAQLDHPSIVRSDGLFEDLKLGVLGIAMELVQGTSLRNLSREGRLSPDQKSVVLEHVAHALDYLHRSGVVHRDVKLDNVLVRESFWQDPTRPEGVKVVDLGIAAVAGSDRDLTQEGTVMGTIPYLAPELLDPATFEGEASSPKVDVFAFGVMGWLLLSGEHPSGLPASSNAVDYTRTYRAKAAPGAEFPTGSFDVRWQAVLSQCLTLSPAERLPDGAAVLTAMEGGSPGSVVVRPSRDGASEPTEVASPRAMLDKTALAEPPQRGSVSAAATVEIGKPKEPIQPKGTRVLPVFTLLVAAGIGLAVAMKLSVEVPRPAPSASARSTASARAPVARMLLDAAPAASDAALESAPPEAAAEPVVPVDACDAGCPSGRACGPEGCDAPLDVADVYALRLARVDSDSKGTSLFATYRTAEVCLSLVGRAPECMPLSEALDGGVTEKYLNVSYTDLVKQGFNLTVQSSVPGQGSAELAHKNAVKLQDGGRRELLCKGLVVEGLTAAADVTIERVVLYLDAPETQPKRCP